MCQCVLAKLFFLCVGKNFNTFVSVLCQVTAKLSVCFVLNVDISTVVLRLPVTVWRLAKVAIFTINVDAEYQTLINHKTICGALNRHFCQTPVTSSNLSFHGVQFLSDLD